MKHFGFILLATLFISCQEQAAYFNNISTNDIGLNTPQPGEWLYEHKESGQTFNQYKKAKPVKPTVDKKIICLQPIGNFNALQNEQIALIRTYLEIYFQLKTTVLASISDETIPSTDRRIRENSWEQLHATFILDSLLKCKMPDSCLVMMGITEKDLYPKPAWNFVFGLAYLKQRVGVSSLFRMQDETLNKENFNLSLVRILKISSHEIGHMFTIKHCTYAHCVMNGANHMQETDLSPIRACSRCQQKLQYSIGYDSQKRLVELLQFFKENNLTAEYNLLSQDAECL